MQFIIVIGNSCDEIMKKRVDRAIEEFKSSPQKRFSYVINDYIPCKKLLFTGSHSSEVDILKMKEYAIYKGIDPKIIITENKSRNTVENIINSEKMIREMLPSCEAYSPDIIICTSSFHISRVMLISKIYFNKYRVSFIHTNETITKNEKARENHAIIQFVESYSKSYIKLIFEQ